MNQAAKEWLMALRSGEFKQVQEALRRDLGDGELGFCCLGVACELYRRETNQGEWELAFVSLGDEGGEVEVEAYAFVGPKVEGKDYEAFRETVLMPPEVAKWLGLQYGEVNPQVTDEDGYTISVAVLNDGGASFEEIADALETLFIQQDEVMK